MELEDSGMDLDDELTADRRSTTALEKIRLVSRELSDAARRARLSSRARAYSGGGFHERRGARAMRWAIMASFFVMVVVPTFAGAIYYGFIASDQYVAEADFTVSSSEAPAPDGLGAFTGIPAIAVIQDTQIVASYIQSRSALEDLEKSVRVKERYTSPRIDGLSRFNTKSPIEKFVKYWHKMADASIKMPAGIIELKIRAFTPEDAQIITQATMEICEKLINTINDRMNHDAVADAEQELQRTSKRLAAALAALESARNDAGLLDTDKTADALNKLANDTKAGLLQMQGQYLSQLKYVSAKAPQMLALKSRIDVTKSQIAEIEAKLTSARRSSGSENTLANAMTKFGELDLEKQVAEHLYAGAAATLELSRMTAERKMMYLKTFVSPVVPQEAKYPRRILYPLVVFAACLALWGCLCGLTLTIRNHMA
jgi:capsular polysaccharide transport system permease protein